MVDGFYGAKRLEEEFPDDYKFLTTFDVDAEYLEDGHHHSYSAPVIIVDKSKDVKQIRYTSKMIPYAKAFRQKIFYSFNNECLFF